MINLQDLKRQIEIDLPIDGGPVERKRIVLELCNYAIELKNENELLRKVAVAANTYEHFYGTSEADMTELRTALAALAERKKRMEAK